MKLQNLARVISAVLHPLLLPTMAFLLLFYIVPLTSFPIDPVLKRWLTLFIFLLSFLIPITCILGCYLFGFIDDLFMEDPKDRRIPFIITTVFYAMLSWRFIFFADFWLYLPVLGVVFGGITLSLFLVTIITFFWKISAHSVGICGVAGVLLGLGYKFDEPQLLYPLLATIILAGALMSARLYLNVHTPLQVLAGCMLGFWISLGTVVLFL